MWLSALISELSAGGIASKATPRKAIELRYQIEVCDEVTRTRVLIACEFLDESRNALPSTVALVGRTASRAIALRSL